MGGYLSGTDVAVGLERRVDAERGRWPASVPWPCSQPGFTEPAPLDAAGALLPHLCTLACAKGEFPQGHRRCVSVALSSRSPALGVTQQAWPSGSPDFPQQVVEDNLLQPPRLLSAFIMPCGHTLENRSFPASGAVAQPDRATVS